ncbi:MAG: YraN family protein [Parcubacteria group bacterium]|nr:YraN family protein [Parcubacteria group bacterium]
MGTHNETGKLGEDIAARYLEDNGFEIVERNYRKPWGEIDIIARKRGVLYFIEVKAVSREISREESVDISRETSNWFQPEDAIHKNKQQRLKRAIETYLASKSSVSRENGGEIKWKFSVIAAFLDTDKRLAKIRFHEDFAL